MKMFYLIFFTVMAFSRGIAQDWEFTKEKDEIKIYTRYENGSKYKSFKGETEFLADFAAVGALIEDVKNFDLWDEDVSEIRVLEQVRGEMLKYYVVYDVPWPATDRDLCVEALITVDQATGSKVIQARSIPEAVPLNDELVRIVEYRQKWIIQPKGNGMIHLTIEGFADPAGDVPAWIANMAITKTPLNMLESARNNFR